MMKRLGLNGGGPWATPPNALNDVRAAAKKLLDRYYPPPYDLIVQPSAYMDAHTLIANTGISQIEKIKELI